MHSRLKLGFPIFLAAINMRAGLVLIGPLIPIIKSYFGLSNSAISILAGIPLICFAATSLIMKKVTRIGSSNLIIKWCMTILAISLFARAFTGLAGLYLFSFVMGISIAVMNYEIPAWVKEHAAKETGLLTGIYVTLMGIAAAISVAISVPLAELSSLSWRMAMVPWIVLAILTAFYWWIKMHNEIAIPIQETVNFWQSKAFKNPLAWALVAFFGLESMTFYATATWFPTLLTTKGFTLSSAAVAVSISGLVGSAIGLTVPHFVGKINDQRLILVLVSGGTATSFYMFTLFSGSALFLWLCISNIGISIAFPLALMLAGQKSITPEATRNLSTMMQSFGYIIASTGPFVMGAIYDHSGSWDAAMRGIVFVSLLQLVMGWIVGKPTKIDF